MAKLLRAVSGLFSPTISPDGTRVLGGSGKLKYVTLSTGVVTQVTVPGAGYLRGGWFDNNTILIQNEADLKLYTWKSGVVIIFKTGRNGGNQFYVSQGNYSGCVNGIRLYFNDIELGNLNFNIDLYGVNLIANHDSEKFVRIWHNASMARNYDPITPPHVVRASQGDYFSYGYFGKSAVISPNRTQQLVNLVPNETPGKIILAPDNTPWVVTSTDTETYLRPLGHTAKTAIILKSPSNRIDALALGNNVIVACDQTNGVCNIFSASFSEALTPIVSSPTPEPPIEPEEPVAIPNHLDVVKAARVKYNSLSGAERAGNIVNQVAWDLRGEGAGTFYKNSGDNYNDRSLDVIIYKPNGETFDILGDAEGAANPQWGRTQPTGFGDVAKWRAATDPGDSIPEPGPTDPARDLLISIRDQINEFLGES